MNRIVKFILIVCFALVLNSCQETLEPKPVDLLTDDIVLNEPKDVPNVEIGLYNSFRDIIPATVIAGDFTADMLIFNGTFTQYRELGTKSITSANTSVSVLWGSIYSTVYIANFMIEKLPTVPGLRASDREKSLAVARFLRGYAYFTALHSFGGIPKVTTTNIQDNRNIPRATVDDINNLILSDYNAALGKLPDVPTNAGFVGNHAVRAALAKFYLYNRNWAQAETFATQIISSNAYELDEDFASVVHQDFPDESILEVGYTISDDPGTDNNLGMNNLFVGRREIIPSNQTVLSLASAESGDRFASIKFNQANLSGNDNGWSVAKYGTKDEDNNNLIVFRLAEQYLIRAEARARLGNITGAIADINVLRDRANAPLINGASQSQLLTLIEEERRYELAFEGHRWYDLVRTGRAPDVMPLFNSNWKKAYELWPIPQREIQNNPSLEGNQNPGY
jgi:starch-binding outer membrane protein, SusD/RagB family